MLVQRFHWLINGEAGYVGRDLEQHAARLAKVDRAEIIAVLLPGWMEAVRCDKLFRHRRLFGIIGRAKGDVMDRAAALPAREKAASLMNVDDRPERRIGRSKAEQR